MPDQVVSVSALNRMAREAVERQLPLMWISGEISNLTVAASGHMYFSLKDAQAQVRAVFFRHKNQYLNFRPANGAQVEALATATLYEARGDFQLQVEGMRPAGIGRLFEAFQKLRARLEAEGLFAAEHKRPLPAFPRAIGIVTSPAAAALRDVLSTLRRRWPACRVILYPAQVQGEGAAAQLCGAIRQASERAEVDVLLLCRGGGSMEDLWAFNDENLARAIRGCSMPVISGVGHETDFTIADFAADLRAPTPTAAAEHASPDGPALRSRLQLMQRRLLQDVERVLNSREQRLDWLARRLLHPAARLQQQEDRLRRLALALRGALHQRLEQLGRQTQTLQQRLWRRRPDLERRQLLLDRLNRRLAAAAQSRLTSLEARLARTAGALPSLNPLAVLQRGYVLAESRGQAVTHSRQLRAGQSISLIWHDGRVEAIVQAVQPHMEDHGEP